MKGKRSGWKGESRRHSLARKGVSTVIDQDRRFDVSNFVAKGRVAHGYDIDKIYNGFIEAMLWSTRDENLKEETFLDYNHTIHDVDKETERAIKYLIEDFIDENYELFDEIQINDDIHISEDQIGHDLFLDTQGHGVGFWDRGYGYNGELLSKESRKFFDDSMYAYAGDDGKIYFEGIKLKSSGIVVEYHTYSGEPTGKRTLPEPPKHIKDRDLNGQYGEWVKKWLSKRIGYDDWRKIRIGDLYEE